MKKKLALLLLTVLLVGVLSGCGSKVDPLEAYKQAGVKTLAAKTSHQIATVTTSASGMQFNVVSDMVVDLASNSASGKFTMEIPGLGNNLNFEAYMVSGQMYMSVPNLDKYVAYPSDTGDLYQSIDPNKITELVTAGSKPTIADATFTVNGKEVKGKKVSLTIDTAKLKAIQQAKYDAASPEAKQLMESALTAFDSMGTTIPVTGFIDADGYLSRMELKVTVSQNGTDVTANTVVESFDFGKSVDIRTPTFTKDNTISFQELMANPQYVQNLIPR